MEKCQYRTSKPLSGGDGGDGGSFCFLRPIIFQSAAGLDPYAVNRGSGISLSEANRITSHTENNRIGWKIIERNIVRTRIIWNPFRVSAPPTASGGNAEAGKMHERGTQ